MKKVPKNQTILWNKFLVILETMCFPSTVAVKINDEKNEEDMEENKDTWI